MRSITDFGDWPAAGRTLLRVATRSEFVRRQLERSPVTAREAAADPDAWRRLYAVTKADFLEDQRLRPPFGTRCQLLPARIGLIVESSGSTGRGREVHYLTRRDMGRLAHLWAGSLGRMGIGAEDIVALTFPVGMAGGGVKHAEAYVQLGAKLLRMASLTTTQKLEAMRYYRASTLVATPAYVDRMAAAAEEAGINLHDNGLRRIVVATQSVTIDWVRRIEEIWGVRIYEWYGTSAGLVAFCCEQGMVNSRGDRGTLHWASSAALQEVVDPDKRWVGDGQRGELVGTPLISEAEPIIRYSTGDEVLFRAPGACPCGSPDPGIESGTVRRLDQMFKIKGVNLWPSDVEATLFGFEAVQDYRVRITLDNARREVIGLDVLVPSGRPDLEGNVVAALREATGLRFQVTIVSDSREWSQETAGEAGKSSRWIDDRQTA